MKKDIDVKKVQAKAFDPTQLPKPGATGNIRKEDVIQQPTKGDFIDIKTNRIKDFQDVKKDSNELILSKNPAPQMGELVAKSQAKELTKLRVQVKNNKKNVWKIVLPILAVLIISVSTGAVFTVQWFNKQAQEKNESIEFNTIKELGTSNEWDAFVTNQLRQVANNQTEINNRIQSNKSQWKKWLAPKSINNEINNDAVKSVKSVTVNPAARAEFNVKFEVVWNDNIKFGEDYDGSVEMNQPLFSYAQISWKATATATIQSIVTSGQPYSSTDEIRAKLREENSTEILRSVIENGNIIESFDFIITGDNTNYTIQVIIVLDAPFVASVPLPAITGITSAFDVLIQWNDLAVAKSTIQNIIGTTSYADLNAVQAKLNLPSSINTIKSLISNNNRIETLTLIVTGDDNDYIVSSDFTLKSGYVSENILSNIRDVKANLLVSNAWTNQAEVKLLLQSMIGTIGYNDVTAIKNKLELQANVDIVKEKITNNHRISDIDYVVTFVAHNNFTVKPILIMNNGYVTSVELPSITNLTGNLNKSFVWDPTATESDIQIVLLAIMRTVGNSSIPALEGALNAQWYTIRGFVTDALLVADMRFRITETGQNPEGNPIYRVNATVIPVVGYLQVGTLTPKTVTYTQKGISLAWTSDAAIKSEINSILNNETFASDAELSTASIKARLEMPANVERIASKTNRPEAINSLTFSVQNVSDNKYTIRTNQNLKPAYSSNTLLADVTNIQITMSIPMQWGNNAVAKTNMQQLIVELGWVNNIPELVKSLNEPQKKNRIKNDLILRNKIVDFNVRIVHVSEPENVKGSYTLILENFTLTTGFVPIVINTTITGLVPN